MSGERLGGHFDLLGCSNPVVAFFRGSSELCGVDRVSPQPTGKCSRPSGHSVGGLASPWPRLSSIRSGSQFPPGCGPLIAFAGQ
jgi:hypothetical protein